MLLKRQVAVFTRPRLAFLLFHKRPSSSWQKGGHIYCVLKLLHWASGPLSQMLDTAKAVTTQSTTLSEMTSEEEDDENLTCMANVEGVLFRVAVSDASFIVLTCRVCFWGAEAVNQ